MAVHPQSRTDSAPITPRAGARRGRLPRKLRGALLGALWLVAAPLASASSGGIETSDVVSDGQEVTIRGSGFGEKPDAKPLYFWDFGHGSTASSPLSRLKYKDAIRGTLSRAVVATGSKSALQVETGGNDKPAGPENGVHFASDSLYVWIKHRYEFDVRKSSGPNGFNLKAFRLWYPFTNNLYIAYQGTGGSIIHPVGTQESGTWFQMRPKADAWVIDEYDYKTSGIGAKDGVLQFAHDGVRAWGPDTRFVMRSEAMPQRYELLFFDQVSNNEIAKGTYQYIDSIYVDDSRQRVVLSDEPSWRDTVNNGPESHREVQIPVRWSDREIRIVVRQGSFDSLAHTYLYVIDADGQPVSTHGYAVTARDAPTAPKGVNVH